MDKTQMTGYKSPINVEPIEIWNCNDEYAKKIVSEFDYDIVADVSYALAVNIDKHELVKALEYDRAQYDKGYADRDAEIIRCKDCICHRNKKTPDNKLYFDLGFCEVLDMHTKDDDYCSYGERKDD